MLAVLSIILIGRAALARRTAVAPAPPEPADVRPTARRVGWRTFGMLMNGALYVALVPTLGYMVSIAGLIASTIYFQGGDLNRRSTAVAVAGALPICGLFVRVLALPHPPVVLAALVYTAFSP